MKEYVWIMEEEQHMMRLDKCVCMLADDISRTRVQQLIEEGKAQVNGTVRKCNFKVKKGDEVCFSIPDNEELQVLPEDIPLDIRYEDADVIVVNKPRGMVVHPANGNPDGTLVNALLYHCKDLSGINGVLRPGIVHRIDKDTSGLIVVAKNDQAHAALSAQLKDKTLYRVYHALLHGVLEHDYGTIDAPIGRDEKDRQKMTVTAVNSKEARTHFRVLERFSAYTLVECRLETGRTHQIRVHMQYIKHPVVGDMKYAMRRTIQTGGQLLHACELRFVHPTTKETITVQAEEPDIFQNVLQTLREEKR
ncbi:MAG: RluA family pseudouridine synthase [Erysipelotrichaceae bacterium]|jgi:23S rRNA pseudouridine1911/1915/1917 synthase|nr:RluA family pseudouridine synthase [Erysipelotrichaceae bacterium]